MYGVQCLGLEVVNVVTTQSLICRLDMAARSDELKAKLEAAPDWDLIICDEAHRMAASYFGGEVKETRRYKLGKLLGTHGHAIFF